MEVEIMIKEMRKSINMTIEQLSKETGINKQRLSDIENGIVKEDEILFIEIVLIAANMGFEIWELYEIKYVELQ